MRRNKLANLILKNLDAKCKKFEIVAASDETTIYLYDVIDNWYGVDSESFIKQLNDIDTSVINLRINSPGGDVFDARAIQTAIKQHKARVVAHIDGLAASAATYIALGADEVRMADGAFFMIHKGWTIALGNSDDFKKTADLLDKVDDSIANDYRAKTGLDKDELIQMMSDETWMSAEEAFEKGFVDSISDTETVDASFDLSVYDKAPAQSAPEPEPKPAFNARTPLYSRITEILERNTA